MQSLSRVENNFEKILFWLLSLIHVSFCFHVFYIYMCIGANALSSLAITWSRGLKLIFDFSTGISAF